MSTGHASDCAPAFGPIHATLGSNDWRALATVMRPHTSSIVSIAPPADSSHRGKEEEEEEEGKEEEECLALPPKLLR